MELPLRLVAAPGARIVRRADGVTEIRPTAPQIEGTVADACRILGGVGPDVVYELIAAGVIQAYKPNPTRRKGRWRVVLASVWAIKETVAEGAAGEKD